MNNIFRWLAPAMALCVAPLAATGVAAAPLTLAQAIDLALERSYVARSARAGATSAGEMAHAANQQPDPMLVLGIDNLPVTGPQRFSTNAEDMTMKRIGIAQEWVSSGKRAARQATAQAMTGREAVMEQVAAAETRLQTALAYLDAYFVGEALKLTTLNERHAREELEAGKGRLATPTGSSAEVLALTSSLGLAEDESGDARQQQGAAAVGLQRWVGPAAEELAAPTLTGPPSEAEFVASHPGVVTRQRDIDVARGAVEVARLNREPNWTWEVSYGQRQGRPDLVSFGVNIPLTVSPAERQDRESAAKLALVDKAEAELAEAQRSAASEYAALSGDARRLQERIERFRTGVIGPAEQRTVATSAAYRSNQAGLVMLFEARHAEVELRRKLLTLQRDLARAQAQLVFKPISQGVAP